MAKQFGVFLPVASGGWIVSTATPRLDGLWPQNRDAAILAEAVGLDFVMSMGKWRGFGGETDHWGVSLESVTMMAAIAAATSRVQIWATLHTLLHNPAVAAKTIATLDHISGGRAGLNIVAGAYRGEFEQMGAWRGDLDHDARYDLAAEWMDCVKRLWSEPRVDFAGRYFALKDCVSEPKPLSQPRPKLICAGMSDKGLAFSAREADACFIGGRDMAETRAASDHARALAAEHGRTIEVFAMCTVVLAETDATAEAAAALYCEHIDVGAVVGMLRSYGVGNAPDNAMTARAQGAFMTQTAIGAPAACAEQIEAFVTGAALDGVMLIFPDYDAGLRQFGAEVLPRLRRTFA